MRKFIAVAAMGAAKPVVVGMGQGDGLGCGRAGPGPRWHAQVAVRKLVLAEWRTVASEGQVRGGSGDTKIALWGGVRDPRAPPRTSGNTRFRNTL